MQGFSNSFTPSPTLLAGNGLIALLTRAGYDVTRLGAGNDTFVGSAGMDAVFAGAGQDRLTGGAGNDILVGGADGDSYVFTAYSGGAGFGHDVIFDGGAASTFDNGDSIVLNGSYGGPGLDPASDVAALSFERAGQDMLISVDGGASSIKVTGMFAAHGDKGVIESVQVVDFVDGTRTFQVIDGAQVSIGNDRDHTTPQHSVNNELLFGTDIGETIYGGTGTNFIWTGNGADTLIFQVNDSTVFGTAGGGGEVDIVDDFDVTMDTLDFSATGAVFADLTVTSDAQGDALIGWESHNAEIADITVELRGVAAADVTADFFVF